MTAFLKLIKYDVRLSQVKQMNSVSSYISCNTDCDHRLQMFFIPNMDMGYVFLTSDACSFIESLDRLLV